MKYNTAIKRNNSWYNSINESQKHAEWNKPDVKEYILYNSIYATF